MSIRPATLAPLLLALACAPNSGSSAGSANGDVQAAAQDRLPPSDSAAAARLASSPRHGEWVMIAAGESDSVRAWVVYPERQEPAPVVVVVHEIYGLTPWIRSVADQLAADGFVAIAPDFLTGKGVSSPPEGPSREAAVAAVRSLSRDEVNRRIDAVARYGMALPSTTDRYGIVGFCWGGSVSFAHAIHAPTLGAAVVYYGSSPDTTALGAVRAPVLGLYGGDDARVNATVPPAERAMQALGRTYEATMYDGAGHGFLRAQEGRDGANLAATRQAWPATVAWFRTHLR